MYVHCDGCRLTATASLGPFYRQFRDVRMGRFFQVRRGLLFHPPNNLGPSGETEIPFFIDDDVDDKISKARLVILSK